MFEELFESSEETYRRKRCQAVEGIREYKGREPTENDICKINNQIVCSKLDI